MNKEEIIQEIHKLAQQISESNSENDLLESARELYEKSVLLKHIDEFSQTSPKIESPKEEPLIVEEKPIEPETPQKEIQSKETIIEKPNISEKKQATIDLFSSETSPAEDASKPDPVKPVQKEPKTAKKKTDESVGETLQHKKITDLKAAIGINEKFQFINELFEGNMKEYNVAIDQINNFTSHEDAENYLADLKDVYKWNEENPITINFLDLVQRRFA